MAAQAFISYARADDQPAPGSKWGFVSAFCDLLDYQLTQLGPLRPKLWRDRSVIEPTGEFPKEIANGIANSDFLIVVLSPNWLDRDWCRHELEWFARRWASEGDAGVRRRILLVNKTPVDRNLRPAPLQMQVGHDFFARNDDRHPDARVQDYFRMGEIRDDRFRDEISELANKLYRLAEGEPPDKPLQLNGRKVFVAWPADDMRRAYDRVVNELKGRGFTILPGAEIPTDHGAIAFIDQALAEAELSIHLLGEDRGYAPANEDRIVRLQLARAAARIQAVAADKDDKTGPPFLRIVWAPKLLEDPEATQQSPIAERDPLAVLARFGDQLDADKIESEGISQFAVFLIAYIDRVAPSPSSPPPGIDGQVYVYHSRVDTEYALQFAKTLRQRSIRPVFPVFGGEPNEIRALHRRRLRDCNTIVLCWAAATEAWTYRAASELGNWRSLGRNEKLTSTLVVAPPSDDRKPVLIEFPPPEVDLVLDLRDHTPPSEEDLDPWLGPSR